MATRATIGAAGAVKPKETVQAGELERDLRAAFLASGLGTFALGLMVIWTEWKPTAASAQAALNWIKPVGPLSGKTGVEVIVFVLSWAILHFALRSRNVNLKTAFAISLVLIVLGLLMTFPPIFDIFAR